jgi:hypothetical protein
VVSAAVVAAAVDPGSFSGLFYPFGPSDLFSGCSGSVVAAAVAVFVPGALSPGSPGPRCH